MEAESGYEIKRARDAVEMVETIQSMIDVSADRLEGLRTQCSTSAELTQQEIRTLEGKLLKHFSRQLVIKARFEEELQRALGDVPCLPQWLRVVGLSAEAIQAVCNRVSTLESLRERSDHELRAFLANARDEEVKRLCRAMNRLRTYTDALARGDAAGEMPLYWDSWERHGRGSPRPRARPRGSVPSDADHATPRKSGKSPTTPVARRQADAAAGGLSKSHSHDSQLSARPDADLSDHSQSSVAEPVPEPPATPLNHALGAAPRSPRTPVGRCMAHDIAHRFAKTFNMIATCDYCDKQMLFGSGLKCKECKFKCHKDCESKVPPSCGLPPEFVNAFKEKVHKDGGYIGCGSPGGAARGSLLAALRRPRRRAPPRAAPYPGAPESSSTTSSCNSSTPSSPAPPAPAPAALHPLKPQFHFPEVKTPMSSPNHVSAAQSPARVVDHKEELTSSVKSEGSRVSLSGSGSTDSGGAPRADSLDAAKHNDARWPRQNSVIVDERMGHPLRRAEAVRGDRHGALRHRVPRQLARRRRGQAAARGAQRPRQAARHLQARGGDVPQDAAREPGAVHGRVHEAAAAGHRDVAMQGHDALHAHPPAQGQVQRQQERARRAADLAGHGLPARARHCPQGPEDQEHLPGEREGRHHRLRPLQRHQALLREQRARRQPRHPAGLAVLPGARAGARAAPARLAAPALLQGHRRLRLRHGVVRAAVRRLPVQGAAARGRHLAGGQGRQAGARQHARQQGHQGHTNGVLGVPAQRAAGLRLAAGDAGEAAAQATGALSLAPRAPLALRGLRLLRAAVAHTDALLAPFHSTHALPHTRAHCCHVTPPHAAGLHSHVDRTAQRT